MTKKPAAAASHHHEPVRQMIWYNPGSKTSPNASARRVALGIAAQPAAERLMAEREAMLEHVPRVVRQRKRHAHVPHRRHEEQAHQTERFIRHRRRQPSVERHGDEQRHDRQKHDVQQFVGQIAVQAQMAIPSRSANSPGDMPTEFARFLARAIVQLRRRMVK